jgi:hypothetical protein
MFWRGLGYLNGEFSTVVGNALSRACGGEAWGGPKNPHSSGDTHGRRMPQQKRGCTSLLFRELAPYIVRVTDRQSAEKAFRTIDGNNHFFVNLAMAACKAMAEQAADVKYSTVVYTISRNGTETGIRVSGLAGEWFTAPATIPRGLYFTGFNETDANPDIGDSTITETAGIGSAAIAASPAIVKFVGGDVKTALEITDRMSKITVTKHKYFTIPYLEFEGTPTGVDVRKVLRLGLPPVADTGIAHRLPGVGQIGAGIVELPMDCFKKALRRYAEVYGLL